MERIFVCAVWLILALASGAEAQNQKLCLQGPAQALSSNALEVVEEQVRTNDHARALTDLVEQMSQHVLAADRDALKSALSRRDYSDALEAVGLSVDEAIAFEIRLANAVEGLLADMPELSRFMPRRNSSSFSDEVVAGLLRAQKAAARDQSPTPWEPRSFWRAVEPTADQSSTTISQSESSAGISSIGLNPPFPPFPPEDGPPGPGERPPQPPEEQESPPDDFDQTRCAPLPTIGGLLACAGAGVGISAGSGGTGTGFGALVYFGCATGVYCLYCEGEAIDDLCNP
jgi:hypothetical protein